MEQIGWSLVDEAGSEVQYWGDAPGAVAGKPDMIRLPNGDDVHCPAPGALQAWKLLPRYHALGADSAISVETDRVVRLTVPTAAMVKAEAQRRIMALIGTSDIISCLIKQSNANMRANELNNILASGGAFSPAEQVESAGLKALADAVKTIRSKSNDLEAMSPIPTDFTSDSYWQ